MKTLILFLASCLAVLLLGQTPVMAQYITENAKEKKQQDAFNEFTPPTDPSHFLRFNFHTNNYLKQPYDLMQKMDSLIDKEWNESSAQWINEDKEEFEYDSNGNNILCTNLKWIEINEWQNAWKIEIEYDNSENPLIMISYEWIVDTHQWLENEKTEITYDADGNMVIAKEFEWDENTEQWVEVFKEESTYNDDGNLILTYQYEKNEATGQWENYTMVERTYDNIGNEILMIYYNWNQQWVESWKRERTYDTNGNRSIEIHYYWNSNQWEREFKSVYTYNPDNQLILNIGYVWIGMQWVAEGKNEKTYDASGNMILEVNYGWDGSANQFIPYSKNELTYNYNYGVDELILPFYFYIFEMNPGSNMLINENGFYFDQDEMLWVQDDRDTYYYSETEIVGIIDHTVSDIKLYPNPSTGYITISWENNYSELNLEIYDVMGNLIINKQITNNASISLDHLADEMYLYKIIDNNKELHSGKIILK